MTQSGGPLPPRVERRLAAWISIKEGPAGTRAPLPGPTITLSRKYGCDAFALAERLKARLDPISDEPWVIFDKALLERVSEAEHLPLKFLEDLGASRFADDSLGFIFPGHVTHDEAFRRLAWHLLLIADSGYAIIVGRGGAVLTRHLEHCFHFRLDASDTFCIASTAQRLGIPTTEAANTMRQCQETRDAFIENYLRTTLDDATHYHAVFNRDRCGLDDIAASILPFVERRCHAGQKQTLRLPVVA